MTTITKLFGPKYKFTYTSCTGVKVNWTSAHNSSERTFYSFDSVKRAFPSDPLFSITGYSNETFGNENGFFFLPVVCSSGKTIFVPSTLRDRNGLAAPNFTLLYRSQTTSRLLSKIKAQRVNLAMALAQYRQTARLFAEVTELLWSSYRCAKNPLRCLANKSKKDLFGRRIIRLKKNTNLKKGSSKYLAYTYGVVPLVNDIQGSIAELEKALNRGILWRVTASDVQHADRPDNIGVSYPEELTIRELKEDRSDVAVAYVEFDRPYLSTLSSLGLTNPAFVAWDLVPFSFVVDWFIDIGTYLDNLDALSGVKRYSAFYTTKHRAVLRRVNKHNGIGHGFRYRTSRTVLSLTPRVNAGSGLSMLRSLNALALLRQRI